MEVPRVEGLIPVKLIGHGGCGRVFHAKDVFGKDCAIKVFDEIAIPRRLLEKMTLRLETGGWPAGVMKVISADFDATHPFWVTPLVVGAGDGADPIPRNLQSGLREHPGATSWKLVRSLARALARMHERRVAHGNLKPANIFFGDDGEVLLSDWTMGNMAGVKHFRFTDAVLYQAPEQLRHVSGYLEE